MTHEWIEDSALFEAVFVCNHSLPVWTPGAIARAFQINQFNEFNDGDVSSDDVSFVHNETGIIVKYEGNMLAVTHRHDEANTEDEKETERRKLAETLTDLFYALMSIDWKSAEVYHPRETLDHFLAVIGRAIPANMDFNVTPAVTGTPITETTEGRALIELGKNTPDLDLIGALAKISEESAQHVAIEAEHASQQGYLDTDNQFDILPVKSGHRVVLLEEFEPDADPVPVNTPSSNKTKAAPHSFSAEPPIFNIDDLPSEPIPKPETIHTPAAPLAPAKIELLPSRENTFASTELATASSALPDSLKEVVPENVAVSKIQSPTIQHEIEDRPLDKPTDMTDCVGRRIGRSFFLFDLPQSPFSTEDIQKYARVADISLESIIHLRVGSIREPIRWDVLGEISLDYPWFSEQLVSAMEIASSELINAEVAEFIMSLKRRESELFPQIRTVYEQFKSQVSKMSPITLAPSGEAFVDLYTPDGKTPASFEGLFTIREVSQSASSQMYIVHVDAMDGPFVDWIVNLLKFVLDSYSRTTRYSKEIAAANELAAAMKLQKARALEEEAALKKEKAKQLYAEFAQNLSTLGLPLPSAA